VFLLYSDGVTEAENPDGEVFGAQGLSDIMEAVHPAPAKEQLSVILKAVQSFCNDLPIRDDLTLVMIKVDNPEDQDRKIIPFVLPSKAANIGPFVKWVQEQLTPYVPEGRSDELVDEFALAISEVLTNQSEHAYQFVTGLIVGRFTLTETRWQVDLYDRGISFDEEVEKDFSINPDDPPLHGYGLQIMHSSLDQCTYERIDDGRNHWSLSKNLIGDGKE
jgi:anti-sigma regulatory factor (Ser/Thr protein kinase)